MRTAALSRTTERPLWQPTPERVAATKLAAFMRKLGDSAGRSFRDYREFHAFTTEDRETFWSAVWDEFGVIGEKGGRILVNDRMPGAEFFPDARLNFAENLLRRDGDGEAIVFRGEDKVETRLTWAELNALVSRVQQWLASQGVTVGSRVAAMMPNMAETVAAMLATTGLGATWARSTSSTPPARPECRNASYTARAAPSCSISRSTGCNRTCAQATGCSTSRPAAG
jgi:acetoacetyl-CoA synthetase